MHIVIMVAGIADPKRPLERPASGQWRDLLAQPTTPFKLSPFDEAALEIALKLRDKNPAIKLTALVTHGAHDLPMMRAVASYRFDQVIGLAPPAEKRADPAWLADHALKAVGADETPIDLVLIGREHGDLDEGMLPAFLAEYWHWPFVGQGQSVEATEDGHLRVERSGKVANEIFTLTQPAVVSITNAKSNKLRHPLMKNVVLAKKQQFEIMTPEDATATGRIATLEATPPEAVARGSVPCEMLQGNLTEQARQLAAMLSSFVNEGFAHGK